MKAIAAAVLLTLPASAIDITEYVDPTYLSLHSSFGMEFDRSPAKVDFTELRAFSFYHKPIHLGGDWDLISYIDFRTASTNLKGNPLIGILSDDIQTDLTRLSVPVAAYHSSDSSRWMYGAWSSLALATDFQHITSDDIFLDFAVGAAYKVNDCLIIGAGAYVSDTLNDPSFIGGVGFFWVPNEDWMISFYGPRFVARWQFAERTQLVYEVATNGGMWNIDANSLSLKYNLQSWRTGLILRHLVWDKLWLEAGAGVTFANKLELQTPGGTSLYNNRIGDLGSSPYAYIGCSIPL